MTKSFQAILLSVLLVFTICHGTAFVVGQPGQGVLGQDGKEQVERSDGVVTTKHGLPIKLVVTRNTAVYRRELEKNAEIPIEPFNIYWKLKPAAGQMHEGKKWFCFGTPDGRQIGWIKEDDCQEWKTPLIYDPVIPTERVFFSVYSDKECKVKIAEFRSPLGQNQRHVVLILDSIDGDLFWTERETLIGKVVDLEFLAGATKGRMGRIFRLREDIVPGISLGL